MPQRVIVVEHPVLADRLAVMRAADTPHGEFRQALLVYMDLVALHMSGQAAPSAAMALASKSAGCWPVVLIRTTKIISATRLCPMQTM